MNSKLGRVKRIAYGDNENQFGDLRIPEGNGSYPVAIVIHGGFWRSSFGLDIMNDVAEALADRGLATWNIEYRRVGQKGGGWPGTLTDAANAVDHLHKVADTNNLDLNRVVTIGHSAGGHLALWLAARHRLPETSNLKTSDSPLPIKGAVSLAGVNDLALMQQVHHIPEERYDSDNNPVRDLLGGTPEEVSDRYEQGSPIQLLPLGLPQVLIHGALDINVPIGISHHYKERADETGDPVKMVELPDAEHFQLIDITSKAWPVIVKETLGLLDE